MNKSRLPGAVCACLLSFVALSANAGLVSRLGGQAYYDDVLSITWLADANYAQTSGFDSDGRMTWADANSWATGLNVSGVTGWRLPMISPINGIFFTASFNNDGSTDSGRNISRPGTVFGGSTANEMAHMFYNTLGNVSDYDVLGVFDDGCAGSCLVNTGPFTNLLPNNYWPSLDLAPSGTLRFEFSAGFQGPINKISTLFAWAVRDGDVPGLTQTDPFLPSSGGGGIWGFSGALSGNWFDPPAVGGYTYTMDGGSLFTGILDFPTGFSPFEVLVGGGSLGTFSPGEPVDFGAGVASFTIQGIDPLVDPDDPSAFPLQLEFDTATADFTMTAVSAVPVPAAFWLFGSGLLGLIGVARRKKA